MEFKNMKQRMIEHFDSSIGSNYLFEVELDKDELWNLYLDSFPEGANPIFRERRYYDCSCCRHFIKNIGPPYSSIKTSTSTQSSNSIPIAP